MARSLASDPLFTKKTTLRGSGRSAESFSAYSCIGEWKKTELVCHRRSICFFCHCSYLRVAVTNPNSYNPGEEVQVSVSLGIEEPFHVSLVEQQRLLEIGCFHRRNVPLMNLQDTAVGQGLVFLRCEVTRWHAVLCMKSELGYRYPGNTAQGWTHLEDSERSLLIKGFPQISPG